MSPKKRKESEPNLGSLTFEEALARLNETVQALETGELPLAEATRLYEKGMGLARICSEMLAAAELKVTQIQTASRSCILGGAVGAHRKPSATHPYPGKRPADLARLESPSVQSERITLSGAGAGFRAAFFDRQMPGRRMLGLLTLRRLAGDPAVTTWASLLN